MAVRYRPSSFGTGMAKYLMCLNRYCKRERLVCASCAKHEDDECPVSHSPVLNFSEAPYILEFPGQPFIGLK
jgi:hypothetical protein